MRVVSTAAAAAMRICELPHGLDCDSISELHLEHGARLTGHLATECLACGFFEAEGRHRGTAVSVLPPGASPLPTRMLRCRTL